MSDVRLVFLNGDIFADISIFNGDLEQDGGMETAVGMSLFSNARASDDDTLPQPGGDRQGWWGDAYADIPGDVTGSKLWLLNRSKQTLDVLVSARQYALDALQWMIDDQVAASVEASPYFPQLGWLGLAVEIDRPQGQGRKRYDFVWSLT